MPNPNVRVTPNTTATALPIKQTARYLGVSPTPLRKGLAAGVYPNLSVNTLVALLGAGTLTAATSATGAPVPVLRLGPAEVDTNDPTRNHLGYSTTMTDPEFLAASDRWWPHAGKDQILAAGALYVACGAIVVGLLDVTGITATHAGNPNGNVIHYTARLVARCTDVIRRDIHIVDQHSDNAGLADGLGRLVLGGRGGSITSL